MWQINVGGAGRLLAYSRRYWRHGKCGVAPAGAAATSGSTPINCGRALSTDVGAPALPCCIIEYIAIIPMLAAIRKFASIRSRREYVQYYIRHSIEGVMGILISVSSLILAGSDAPSRLAEYYSSFLVEYFISSCERIKYLTFHREPVLLLPLQSMTRFVSMCEKY